MMMKDKEMMMGKDRMAGSMEGVSDDVDSSEGKYLTKEKARKEALLRRLMNMHNISRVEALELMERLGGVDEAWKRFQLKKKDEYEREVEDTGGILREMKTRTRGIQKVTDNE